MMNEHGKSDRPIVPGKSPNKPEFRRRRRWREGVWPRGNLSQQNASGLRAGATRHGWSRYDRRQKETRDVSHRSAAPHLTGSTPAVAYSQLKGGGSGSGRGDMAALRRGARGKLQNLSHRLKRGAYRPSRCVEFTFPRADGRPAAARRHGRSKTDVQRATVEG